MDKTLRDLCCQDNLPFGGKLIVLGGDFRQILPVIKNASKNTIISETIKYSFVWNNFRIFRLTQNMRNDNQMFNKLLLNIGDGVIKEFKIPLKWQTNDVATKIYGEKIAVNYDLSRKIILTGYNEDVHKINEKILNELEGDSKTYYSIDLARHKGIDQGDRNCDLEYPVEYLNSLKISGLPTHKLKLKKGAIVMLLRNLSINDGLCNGTRLKVLELFKFNIKVEIITGTNIGNIAYIPRIQLQTPENSKLPFILFRRQFPLVIAFAITINKSQGQSFDEVGIYIRKPLFSHGQLYVALSRCKNAYKLFIENNSDDKESVNNIVWEDALDYF